MMWYWGGGVHWWGWLLMSLGMVAFWSVIVWAVWYLMTNVARRPADHPNGAGDAKRILDERLARGEIDPDEYRRLLTVIRGGDHAGDGQFPVGTGGQR